MYCQIPRTIKMKIKITHDQENNNFYVKIGDKVCYLRYRIYDNIIDFYVTFVDPELRGKGIAAKLVEEAIKYAQEMEFKINPTCSYASQYINRKKNHKELLSN